MAEVRTLIPDTGYGSPNWGPEGLGFPAELSAIQSPRDILGLAADKLYALLRAAHAEMAAIEQALKKTEETIAKANEDKRLLLEYKDPKNRQRASLVQYKISPLDIVGILCFLVGALILYLLIKFAGSGSIAENFSALLRVSYGATITFITLGMVILGLVIMIRGNFKHASENKLQAIEIQRQIEERLAEADQIYAETQKKIDTVRATRLVPQDYRYALALSTMVKFLENGRAENWGGLVDKYEEQLHRWTLEQNSAENLEYQKFIALKAEETAAATQVTAVATSVSAVINVAGLFF
jgi:hypothetical protein